jgi:hypothetical protein
MFYENRPHWVKKREFYTDLKNVNMPCDKKDKTKKKLKGKKIQMVVLVIQISALIF